MSPLVHGELQLALDLAPMVYRNLFRPFGTIIVAYDASTTGGAVVYARTDSITVEKFAKFEAQNCIDNPDYNVSPIEQTAALISCGFKNLRWNLAVRKDFRDIDEHINTLECEMLCTALEWLSRAEENLGRRHLFFGDNQAVVYSATKGRSSRPGLQHLLRRVAAYELALDAHLYHAWVPTAINPADEDSRYFEPKAVEARLGIPAHRGGTDAKLWAGIIKRSTAKQYRAGLQRLCVWIDSNAQERLSGEASWDRLTARFLLAQRRLGKDASYGRPVLAGLRHLLPGIPLPMSNRALKAWGLDSEPQHHACMSNSANILLVYFALLRGWYTTAAWLRVSFICLLRVSAASRILWPSVFLPGDIRLVDLPSQCFLRIGRDKRHTSAVMVDVPDPLAVALLRLTLEIRHSRDLRLFQASASTLRKRMGILCQDLGWTHLHLVPHSLRYGGAVFDRFVRKLPIEAVQVRGRWRVISSCDAYITKGLSSLANVRYPRSSERMLRKTPELTVVMLRVVRRLRRQVEAEGRAQLRNAA